MDNIKNAQQQVENLASKGYIHPENAVYNSSGAYMTYSDQGNNPYVMKNRRDPYMMYGDIDRVDGKENKQNSEAHVESTQQEKPPVTQCPQCGLSPSYECDCMYHEVMCKNGHIWYTLKNGVIVEENPHSAR